MNVLKSPLRLAPILLALTPALLWSPGSHAASVFSASAELTYTITGIANLDHPGQLSGLSVTGWFQPAPSPDYALTLNGDGAIQDENPETGLVAVTPIAVGSGFSRAYSVNGDVRDGNVDFSGLGLFGLSFENMGSDTYALSLTLNYRLQTSAHGQYADSAIYLDYYNASHTFIGSEQVVASVFETPATGVDGTTSVFNFTLTPGVSETLHADVLIAGSVEASPVPLPAGVWLMMTGLSTLAACARRRRV
ncbi:VPLPA-CTERM sorting domain-containing protein [Methylococcus sp. EFPC2]|uniref:VPLPA-CTERM sorting domain-containing protein n=1 Tax=Methylococcus sp. EFPC2 TaxID=2812648 RepID=UPI0019688CF8|nr:VPLPA-CTERM sorting domain-containing protein [Methylococcus sp. EFPC2]QSA97030.1 VPLPA-CTERM sorting domain-containing protein [Methylococcus sp. EFPC2]